MNADKIVLVLSFILGVLIIMASYIGLFTPDFYHAETENWQAQSIGQDIINLVLIAPVLFITAALVARKNRMAEFIWGGVVLYLIYTYTLYCFDVHFNKLFIVYCLCLGLSFYSFIYFLYRQFNRQVNYPVSGLLRNVIGVYFIVIATLFYFLWLTDSITAIIQNKTPASIVEAGLTTNGVHVLDIAVILPAIFIVGIFLMRNKKPGLMLTPVMLTFLILMDITIGALVVVMKVRNIANDLMLVYIMGVLTLISLLLLIWYFKSYSIVKPMASQDLYEKEIANVD